MTATWRAEALKVRRSAAARLPWVGLAIGLIQGLGFLRSEAAVQTWAGLTVWHTLWTTFLLPLFLALLVGLTAIRESRARGGGLWWRPLPWEAQGRTELAWLAWLSLLMNAAVVLPSLLFGTLVHLPGDPPLGRLLGLTAALTLASLPLLALGQRLARRFGLIAALVVAFVGNFSGIALSEGRWWFLDPWAWPIRATFTLTGTQANGLPLALDSSLWQVSPWPVVGVALAVFGVLAFLPYALPLLGGHPRRGTAGTLRGWRWTGPLASELVKYRHTALPWLMTVTPVLVVVLGQTLLDARGLWEFWTLLVLPFAVALVPALGWGQEAESWRVLRARAISPTRLYGTKLLVLWLAALLSGVVLFVAAALISQPLPRPAPLLTLLALSSFALLAFHLWLAMRFSPAVTLGVGLIGTLLAALLGGTGLGAGLWPFFPWVWASVLTFTETAALWPYLLALAVLGGVFFWLGTRATLRES
ncbi:hypothetical protein ACFP9V_11410 [Deinococcus radiopugnans]|uniref:ABC-2 type transport system permease protein n=1 Tax=Deinococcus radiopugnans ATCC 19172 TaxID=585398 RepID=A0A5C4Y9M1_9DEIO|nr:hypothetical protein [Deinococcus radiopugnans]MBB6015988.1 ABC-2 type transport system permease protein [Deinococcus radiopugnans ATCC 19172]TNM72324.1 hypothetical protein FHR04_03225 [Deinococcus radiopugnans ATCC 19172]